MAKVQLSRKRLQEHVVELAAAFNVPMMQDEKITLNEACNISLRVGGLVVNTVVAPCATDEWTYACCLHELGHALHPCGQLRQGINGDETSDQLSLKLDEEHYAWEWAKHHALVWTKGMQDSMDYAYGTHAKSVGRERGAPLRAAARSSGQTLEDFLQKILREK